MTFLIFVAGLTAGVFLGAIAIAAFVIGGRADDDQRTAELELAAQTQP